MNIAIITFSDFNTNYGSILQALALRTFLESEGHVVTFIKYREFHPIQKGSIVNSLRCLCINIYNWLYRNQKNKRTRNFREFIDAHLPHTRLYTSEEDLEQNLELFDAYICGSDQIWNIECLGGMRTPYFLKFVPVGKYKIAYAPSMGDYCPCEDTKRHLKEMLASFDAISTRETSSSLMLSELLNKHVQTVVDPTLLLDNKQWLKMVGKKDIPNGEYAVCYFVRRHKLANKIVRYFKKIYKVPVYNVSDNLIHVRGTKNDYITCAPDVFVNLVANAKFCIGASFHLAAFSTIFDKHCYIVSTGHNKSRVSELFSLIERIDHMTDGHFEKLPNINGMIDYARYDSKVDQSKKFIRKSLEEYSSF